MITVYVIRSLKKSFRYVGITNNISRRFEEHNQKKNKSTKFYAPFQLILSERLVDRKLARQREKFLKSGAGRKFLDNLESIR